MVRFMYWDEETVEGLSKSGLTRLVAEIDDDGVVTRELAFDDQGRLVHRCPGGRGTEGTYGFFDMARFAPSQESLLSKADFNELWSMPDFVPEKPPRHSFGWIVIVVVAAGLAVAAFVASS
jgi:hypothetical protein